MNKELVVAISDMREDDALHLVREMIQTGEDPAEILESCREAMRIIDDRYQRDEYFIPELVMSAEILKRISEVLEGSLANHGGKPLSAPGRAAAERAIRWLKVAGHFEQPTSYTRRTYNPVPDVLLRAFPDETGKQTRKGEL